MSRAELVGAPTGLGPWPCTVCPSTARLRRFAQGDKAAFVVKGYQRLVRFVVRSATMLNPEGQRIFEQRAFLSRTDLFERFSHLPYSRWTLVAKREQVPIHHDAAEIFVGVVNDTFVAGQRVGSRLRIQNSLCECGILVGVEARPRYVKAALHGIRRSNGDD
jgi:hypothetical protein